MATSRASASEAAGKRAPFPFRRAPELDGAAPRHKVAIVGAGPVGLALAIDLATRGIASVVLDDDDTVSVGSRAICWAKRTLEIFDRLGIGDRMAAKGVTWKHGRFYRGEAEIYTIDLLPEAGHKMPAFINLQQYYVEEYLIDRAGDFPDLIDLRWRSRVVGLEPGCASPSGNKPPHPRHAEEARYAPSRSTHHGPACFETSAARAPQHDEGGSHEPTSDGAILHVDTPDGPYRLAADWVIAADGARSAVRRMLGLAFEGRAFEEQFLIADVKVATDLPNERRFWFKPTFDPGESVLLHRQPHDVFRLDFQLGPEADAEREKEPARVLARVRRVLGDVPLTLEWCSVYRFRCARIARFVQGRVVFVGDSAHVVSPFGARGGNGGIQDVDNLAWKLALVLRGEAPATLIETYDEERGRGADENILNSARTTGFMTPKSAVERAFRDGVLALSADHAFARALVNGGRLSTPCSLDGLALQTPDDGAVAGPMVPGAPCLDAPIAGPDGRPGWLLGALGDGFAALVFAGPDGAAPASLAALPPAIRPLLVLPPGTRALPGAPPHVVDAAGLVAARYGGAPGVAYLIRPDGHVAARFGRFDAALLAPAHRRATGAEPVGIRSAA